ncbi:MAG: Fe-S oxidoreductase, partial [Parcubacteria group bacterium GW2011_GWD2_38_12]
KRFEINDLKKLKGLAFWEGKKIVQTEIRSPIMPMDAIPVPARDLMKIEKCTHVFSSRGCPYRCVFCASSRFWNKTRFFSAKYVVSEIKNLYENYGLTIMGEGYVKEIIKTLE